MPPTAVATGVPARVARRRGPGADQEHRADPVGVGAAIYLEEYASASWWKPWWASAPAWLARCA